MLYEIQKKMKTEKRESCNLLSFLYFCLRTQKTFQYCKGFLCNCLRNLYNHSSFVVYSRAINHEEGLHDHENTKRNYQKSLPKVKRTKKHPDISIRKYFLFSLFYASVFLGLLQQQFKNGATFVICHPIKKLEWFVVVIFVASIFSNTLVFVVWKNIAWW